MDGLSIVAHIAVGLVFIKSVIVGSNFSIYKWLKYGKAYIEEYNDWMKEQP